MLSRKILLAEDDADDRILFNRFLQKRDDVVLLPPVENGIELIDYLINTEDENLLPDAIILDQNMPMQNGLQTLQLLKQTSKYAHIPVMLYSTFADENLIKSGEVSGALLVHQKPITNEGYNNMLDAFLNVI